MFKKLQGNIHCFKSQVDITVMNQVDITVMDQVDITFTNQVDITVVKWISKKLSR